MMEGQESRRGARWLRRRVERKGFLPRVAAGVIASLWIVAIVAFGIVEHLVDPKSFDTVWLGMWWATQTVTTVGYGDFVPDQPAGQLIATILMIGGLSFFAVITGAITSLFVTRADAERRASGDDPMVRRLDQIGEQVAGLRADLERLSRADDSRDQA
jgi:voltage-gated potassium channel